MLNHAPRHRALGVQEVQSAFCKRPHYVAVSGQLHVSTTSNTRKEHLTRGNQKARRDSEPVCTFWRPETSYPCREMNSSVLQPADQWLYRLCNPGSKVCHVNFIFANRYTRSITCRNQKIFKNSLNISECRLTLLVQQRERLLASAVGRWDRPS